MKANNIPITNGSLSHPLNKNQILASRPHKRAWIHLRYALEQGAKFVVLTGPSGMGKTVVIQLMLDELQSQAAQTIHLSGAKMSLNGLLNAVVSAIDPKLAGANASQQLQFLSDRERFTASANTKQIVVIVDNAENLLPADLNTIQKILKHEHLRNRFQFLLSGNQDFALMLSFKEFSELNGQVEISYDLQPMSATDSHAFILQELAALDYPKDLEANELGYLIEKGKGIPGLIKNSLQIMLKTEQHSSNEKLSLSMDHAPSLENQEASLSLPAEDPVGDVAEADTGSKWFDKGTLTTAVVAYLISVLLAAGTIMLQEEELSNQDNDQFITHEAMVHEQDVKTLVQRPLAISQSSITVQSDATETMEPTEVTEFAVVTTAEPVMQHESHVMEEAPIQAQPVATRLESHKVESKAIHSVVAPIKSVKIAPPEVAKKTNVPAPMPAEKVVKAIPVVAAAPSVSELNNSTIPAPKQQVATQSPVTIAIKDPEKQLPTDLEPAKEKNPQALSVSELNALMAKFTLAYQAGEITEIGQLITENIQSNEITNKRKFLKEYSKLFNITSSRNIQISRIKWVKQADGIQGQGEFSVSLRERGTAMTYNQKGSITLRVIQQENGYKLEQMHYLYSKS